MVTGLDPEKAPERVAIYRRTLPVSIARVWENVYDWEHLPWLHSESFSVIELEESGNWGWRAKVGVPSGSPGGRIRIELRVDRSANRYVTRTLEGPGEGTEIWTSLSERSPVQTAITVSFHVPGKEGPQADRMGQALVALYSRLWDQDESMMIEREVRAATKLADRPAPLRLGRLEAIRSELPKTLTFGGSRVRLVDLDGTLHAHSLVCPHWSGPLEADSEDDLILVCPWHGYRYDLRTGGSCDGRAFRLRPGPEVSVEDGEVILLPVKG